MAENRKHARKYLVAEVKVERRDVRSITNALAINISEEGIGLYTTEAFKPGEKVTVVITILMADSALVSEAVQGAVRWTQPLEKKFATGIKFDKKITKKDFPILSRSLEYSNG